MSSINSRGTILNAYRCNRKRPSKPPAELPCLQPPDKAVINSSSGNSEAVAFLNNRLSKGGALGNVVFKSSNGISFKCTRDCIGGRGLRVHQTVPKGVTIARGDGELIQYSDLSSVPHTLDFKIWDSHNKILHLHAPTVQSPANLANTSDGKNHKNNCRIKHRAGTHFFSIETVKALRPGDEVTVAYGSKFTKYVRAVAQIESVLSKAEKARSTSLVNCDRCNLLLLSYRLKKHRGRIFCRMRQSECNK